LYGSLADKSDEAKLDYNLGQSLLLQEKYQDAIAVFTKTLDKVKESGDTTTTSRVLLGLGISYYLAGDFAKSLQCYLDALSASKDSTSIETQWNCNLGVGKAYKALKQYNEARPYLETAVALVEKERGNLSRDSFKTHMLDVRRDCFIELIELFGLLNLPYESLEVAERGKARAFLDMLMNRNEKQIELGDSSSTSYLTDIKSGNDSGSRSVSVNSRNTTVTIDDNLISPINAQAPSIDEIKKLVKNSNSTFVEYWATGKKIYVWVVRPDGDIHMPPPIVIRDEALKINDEAVQRINKLAAQIITPIKTAEQMRSLGMQRQENLRKLYTLLIKPIEQYLPIAKDAVVTIVPHNYLFAIPFASLIAPDGDFLVEKHTLSYAPAIGVLRATEALGEEVKEKPHRLLAFGNPITKEIAFLGALPYSEKEVKHIAELYGNSNATVEIGADATKEKFSSLAPQATDIHLATHGLIDQEHPMRSGLVLAPTATDDGLLTVRDILTIKNLKARMVVLSACQTARGKITGDGVVGLSRAFIIAGTPSVLVSQWNVDDVMTEYQMTKFYRSYLKGMNKAQALRDAQLATIKFIENAPEGTRPQADPNYLRANPRFWSAFQLIGEYH
jgi:CHAT domain-containing protein